MAARSEGGAQLTGPGPAALPERVAHQLATPAREPPSGPGWLHELKLDGYRLGLRVDGGEARVWTRGGREWSARFPDLVRAARALGAHRALLDGEAVVLDAQGHARFEELQQALDRPHPRLYFYAFDLVHLDGHDLCGWPLRARKELLQPLLEAARADDVLRHCDHFEGDGRAFLEQARRAGAEGIVCKRADAPYRSGRAGSWLKIKCGRRQSFAVVGFTEPQGTRTGLGALLLAVYAQGTWVYAGKVGSGFSQETLCELRERLGALETPAASLVTSLVPAELRLVHWVRPELVAEVSFREWTRAGELRHAVFERLCEDQSPPEAVRRS
jgi:bifunctional non-homologous end joining protein LigD